VRVSLRFQAIVIAASTALLAAPAAAHAAETILILQQPELPKEGEILFEAMRIYAGNLGCDIRDGTGAPLVLDPIGLDRLQNAAREQRADFVLWTGRRPRGAAMYYTLDAATGDLRETEIGPAGAETAAEEVALKVRALVSSRRRSAAVRSSLAARPRDGGAAPAAGAPAITPAPAPTPAGAEPPIAAPVKVEPTAPAPPPLEGTPTAPVEPLVAHVSPSRPPEVPPPPARVELGAAFGLVSPRDRTWLRSGIVLDAAARLGARSRLWVFVESALTTRPSSTVRGFEVTFRDVPVTAGARFRIAMTHGNVVLGSRTSLHVLDVTAAAPDGRAASSRQYALGLGAVALVEAGLGYHLKAFLGATVEGLVPSQGFTIAGEPAVTTGDVLYGATAGVALSLP
jgi:hypothetical protein